MHAEDFRAADQRALILRVLHLSSIRMNKASPFLFSDRENGIQVGVGILAGLQGTP